MKRKPASISRLAIVVITAGSLCVIGSVRAVEDTSTSDNPHLRRKAPSTTEKKAPTLSEKDKSFMLDAAAGGAQEVEDGKIAEKQGQSTDVKKVGARMVSDHSKANKELIDLGKKKGLGITTDNIKARKWGESNFDKQYLATLEAEHKKDIKAFEQEAKSGDDADIKAWASKTLPTLKGHLAMIKDAMKK